MAGSTIEMLSSEECRRVLQEHTLGRIGVVVGDQPFIFPVNYVFDSNSIVFRTDPGTKLAGSAFGPVVFEIDGVDEERRTGWSVIVEGVSTEINEAVDTVSEHLHRLDVQPWAPGEKSRWVALRAEAISGRRVMRL